MPRTRTRTIPRRLRWFRVELASMVKPPQAYPVTRMAGMAHRVFIASVSSHVGRRPPCLNLQLPILVRRGSHDPAVAPTFVRRGSHDPAVSPTIVRRGSHDPAVSPTIVRRGSHDPAVSPTIVRRGSHDPAVSPTEGLVR